MAEEMESLNLEQIQLAEAVMRLRRAAIASLLLATLTIVMVLLKYL